MQQTEAELLERASWLLRHPPETPTIPFSDEATGCTLRRLFDDVAAGL